MLYLYLIAGGVGLLLAVRLMFFGAERRRIAEGALPLRRSEPALVAFLMMFGVSGYLLSRHASISPLARALAALLLGATWAFAVARVAIAMARVTPEHDPDDPRFALQGRVGVVDAEIPAASIGRMSYEDATGIHTVAARSVDGEPIPVGMEVCIERIEDGVAVVERWSLVEARL
jgi:membrane protein implicated in regulation of membrane protease activity